MIGNKSPLGSTALPGGLAPRGAAVLPEAPRLPARVLQASRSPAQLSLVLRPRTGGR